MDSDYDSDDSYWCRTSRGYPRTAASRLDDDNDDSFSQNGESDRCDSPSEPDHHDTEHNNTGCENDGTNAKWEGDGDGDGDGDEYEPEGLRYANNEGCEGRVLNYEGDGEYKHGEPDYKVEEDRYHLRGLKCRYKELYECGEWPHEGEYNGEVHEPGSWGTRMWIQHTSTRARRC